MTKILATFFAVEVATASGAATERDSDVVIQRDYLRTAAAACRANDFDTFFNDFMWSADVRRRYTGATVEERSIAAPTRPGTVRPATPDRFDIELIQDPGRKSVAAFTHHALLGLQEFSDVGLVHVLISIAVEIMPGADELRIRGA